MIKNFKYRLKPNKEQEDRLDNSFFVSNQAWNHILDIKIKNLKRKNGFTPFNLIYKSCLINLEKRNLKSNSGIIQSSLLNCEKTFQQFFKSKREEGERGFPKFKNSNFIEQSFEFKNQGIKITDKYFQIMRMKIKWNYHRELPSWPKKIIVKRESDGKFYVIFSVEVDKEELPKTGKKCGIDLNVNNISIAESTGKTYLKTINKLAKYDKKYMKIQRSLTKRYEVKNRSKNTKKLQKKLNKIHKKVRNVKEDFFHKVSKDLVKNFDLIRAEKLEKKKMKENAPSKHMRRSIAEVSWDSLIQKIKYKAEMHGKVFEEINPAYTSQRCNVCGYINRKNRTTQEKFCCKECGHSDNADCNAAKNILEYEKWFLEQKTRYAARHSESLKAS